MEIIKVANMEQMTANDVYYEYEGEFYSRCWSCGSPVKVDYHRTAVDLRREIPGEEQYFCGESCRERYIASGGEIY